MKRKREFTHPTKKLYDSENNMSEKILSRISAVEGAPASTGKSLYLKYLYGDVLTARQSILAFCCQCMGYYHDGRHDCENYLCPLYPLMPYGECRKKYVRPEKKGDK